MNRVEIERLAAAIAALRPDWPLASLRTGIGQDLADRPWLDAAVALTWVACDPDSHTPRRVLEAGPWWHATRATVHRTGLVALDELCIVCARPEPDCRAAAVPSDDQPHEYRSRRQAAIVRARAAHRERQRPEPPGWTPAGGAGPIPGDVRQSITAALAKGRADFARRQAELDRQRTTATAQEA